MAFTDFPAQQNVTHILQRSLEGARVAHAYLFTGQRLEELEGVARALAKTLNCRSHAKRGVSNLALDSCDQCLSCRKIEGAIHPDVQWVRPESKSRVVTIDQIRDLMQIIHLKPTEAAYKVGVIVAADRLNVQAANAFLKTLEEPHPKSVFVLLSTEPQRVLETVLSRCLRLNFTGENGLHIMHASWLKSFSSMAIESQKGLLGRYRLLGSLLAQLYQIKAAAEKGVSLQSPLGQYDDIEPRLREKWEEELSAAIEAEYRRQRTDVLAGLQWWFRDIWLQTLALGHDFLSFPDLSAATQKIARRISSNEAMENLLVLEQAQRLLGSNVQEALALEVTLLKLKL